MWEFAQCCFIFLQDNWGKVGPSDARRVCALPKPSGWGRVAVTIAKVSLYSALAYGAYRVVEKTGVIEGIGARMTTTNG